MPLRPTPDTHATVSLPGAPSGPVVVPTTVLSMAEAELLRDYTVFLEARQLAEALFCLECHETAIEGVRIRVQPNQVIVACPHRLLFYQGPIPPPTRFTMMAEAAAQHRILTAPTGIFVPGNEPDDETLFRTEAQLLRHYREFLLKHRVREALTCTTCWGLGFNDGTRTYVTDLTIGIICRHRRLTFVGQTI